MASKTEEYLGLKDYKVIGTRPIRHDGVDKVTGRAIYGADVQLTGLLHGKVLRSPHAHARIRSIDTSRAESLPGVKAVITAKDIPVPEAGATSLGKSGMNLSYLRESVLADKKVLFHGHPVAAVASANPNVAEEALDLIEVDYELLPPVLDVREAMKDDAPLLLEDQTTNVGGEGNWKPEYSESVRGRDVVILEDNDEKGCKHGEVVSKSLQGFAKSIRILKFPELGVGDDVTDYLSSHTIDIT